MLFLLAGVVGGSDELTTASIWGTTAGEIGASFTDAVVEPEVVETSATGAGDSEIMADSAGRVSTVEVAGELAELTVLFLCPFAFSPFIDEDTALKSFGFCFKSKFSFDTLMTFLEGGFSFGAVVSVDCSIGGVVGDSAVEADTGRDVDVIGAGDDLFGCSSCFADPRARFLGGDLSAVSTPVIDGCEGSVSFCGVE